MSIKPTSVNLVLIYQIYNFCTLNSCENTYHIIIKQVDMALKNDILVIMFIKMHREERR